MNLEPFRADFERSDASTTPLDITDRFTKEKMFHDFFIKSAHFLLVSAHFLDGF